MEEKIKSALKEPLKELGVSIYSISLEEEDGVNTLFIRLESETKVIDTDLCSQCSEIINPIIDTLDLSEIQGDYVLDICSKGVEYE